MKINMAKTKSNKIHAPLVVTGYSLFVLLLVSVFFSTTLPWTSILSHPNSIKIHAAVAMISLTIGALLPVVVGYIIGDHSAKSKSKLSHHFNGMLFGLFAYWCMVLTTVFITVPTQLFPDTNARLVLVNVLPGIFVAIVASVIAGMHVRSKQATLDVLEYRPFVLVFVASIIAMPLLGVINNIVTNSVTVFTFFTPFTALLFGLISYVTLNTSKLSSLQKSAWSAVSLSVLFVAVYVMNLFESAVMGYLWQPSTDVQTIGDWVAFSVALAGWILYWTYQVKALQGTKK